LRGWGESRSSTKGLNWDLVLVVDYWWSWNVGAGNGVNRIVSVEMGNITGIMNWSLVASWKVAGEVTEQVEALEVVLGRKVLDEDVFEVLSVEPKVTTFYCQL